MIRHLFHKIDEILPPKEATETDRKGPISFKKLGQRYGTWSTQKTVLGRNFDIVSQLVFLLPIRKYKVEAALKATPRTYHTTSLHKWRNLLEILQSITPDAAG